MSTVPSETQKHARRRPALILLLDCSSHAFLWRAPPFCYGENAIFPYSGPHRARDALAVSYATNAVRRTDPSGKGGQVGVAHFDHATKCLGAFHPWLCPNCFVTNPASLYVAQDNWSTMLGYFNVMEVLRSCGVYAKR
jgi:hypothetical protein